MTIPVKQQRSMLIPILIIVSALLLGTVIGVFWLIPTLQPTTQQAWITPAQGESLLQGRNLYQQQCASCHGVELQGQPDWRKRLDNGRLPAPPHDESGHTWHHPDQLLIQMIKFGFVPGQTAPEGYVSDMPAYDNILTHDEITLILAYIKTFWSKQSLEAQREITLQRGATN